MAIVNTFESLTREQVHSNSFTERVRKRSLIVGSKLSRIVRSHNFFCIGLMLLSVNGKTNPISKHLGLANNLKSFTLVLNGVFISCSCLL